MINLAISIGSAIATYALFFFAIGGGHIWSAIFAVAVFMTLNYLLSRRIMNKVTDIMESASKTLQTGKFDLAIKGMEGGLKYGKWVIMIESQIRAQIGTVQYLKKDFNAAFPNLQKSVAKNWVSMGMLAVIYMRKKDYANMIKTFEKAVKACPKEAILWNLYAYCLVKTDERDKAIAVLNRALKKNKDDERTASNLNALQNNAKMKMKSFGELWYQFHLENVPMSMRIQAGSRGSKGSRRIVRR